MELCVVDAADELIRVALAISVSINTTYDRTVDVFLPNKKDSLYIKSHSEL
jgi:hypothetical protein